MSRPARRPIVSPEATQELRAADALELFGTPSAPSSAPATPSQPALGRPTGRAALTASQSSIAPVGLDLMAAAAAARTRGREREEDVDATVEIRRPARRRMVGGVILGVAVAGCAAILVAAIARIGHAASATSTATDTPPAATAPAAPAVTAAAPDPVPAPAAVPDPGPGAPAPPSTGAVRIDKPATPARVWVDGKKLTSSSVDLACGTHLVKVGTGRAHSIDVPCGGVIGISR